MGEASVLHDHHPPHVTARMLRPHGRDHTYYRNCAIGGILSCGVMHTLITPLDVMKCNLQANPNKYQNIGRGLRLLLHEEGMYGLWKGWQPTLLAYSLQGAFKFGLYEYFKHSMMGGNMMTMMPNDKKDAYRGLVYIASAAIAECIADVFMCPWEMVGQSIAYIMTKR